MLAIFTVLMMLASLLGVNPEEPAEWNEASVNLTLSLCEIAGEEATNHQLKEELIFALYAWAGYLADELEQDQNLLGLVLIQTLMEDMREQSAMILEHAEGMRDSGGAAAVYEAYECAGQIIFNIADEYAELLGE